MKTRETESSKKLLILSTDIITVNTKCYNDVISIIKETHNKNELLQVIYIFTIEESCAAHICVTPHCLG